MKDLVIRISEPDGGEVDYPVALVDLEENTKKASGSIPADLKLPVIDCAVVEQTIQNGVPVRDGILEFYAQTKDQSEEFKSLGSYLYRLIFRDEVETSWRGLRTASPETRTLLEIEPSAIRDLPWELMQRDPHEPPVFLNLQHHICRALPDHGDFSADPVRLEWPMRMLLVVGCPRNDSIAWRRELLAIERVVHELGARIDYLPLHQPGHGTIVKELRDHQPHIFHFIGHGEKGAADGCLKLGAADWPVAEMIADIQNCTELQVAVVNACHTNSAGGIEGSWAVNRTFIEQGTWAVIGMQGDVLGECAADFAASVYRDLASGKPIDVAVTKARDQIRLFEDKHGRIGLHNREWSLPQLYLARHPDTILGFSPSHEAMNDNYKDFSGARYHVDRYKPRREFYGDSCWLRQNGPGVAILKGGPEVGKTDFVRRCLAVCVVRGEQVRYLDLQAPRPPQKHDTSFEILDRMIKGMNSACFLRPLPVEAFSGFYRRAKFLCPDLPQNVAAPDDVHDALDDGADSPVDAMIRAFLQDAKAYAGETPFLLVFDHAGGEGQAAENAALRKLAELLGEGKYAPVKMLLVVRDAHVSRLSDLDAVVKELRLERIEESFEALAEQFLSLHEHCHQGSGVEARKAIEQLVAFYTAQNDLHPPWPGGELGRLLNAWNIIKKR